MKDLKILERSHIQLSDIFKQIEIEILNNEKTDLDFFRYRPPRTKAIPLNVKKIIRKKFRVAVINFCKQIKSGEKEQLPALEALKKFQIDRQKQLKKLNDLKFNSKKKK